MSVIIFNEANRNKTARYRLHGFEKAIVVRASTPSFNLKIETMSLSDPHCRSVPFMDINTPGDYLIDKMAVGSGMELVFKIDGKIDPDANLFVEIVSDGNICRANL